MAMWNPWRGCKKCSDGCLYCYIHKGDAKRGVDTSIIEKTKDFAKPKIPSIAHNPDYKENNSEQKHIENIHPDGISQRQT